MRILRNSEFDDCPPPGFTFHYKGEELLAERQRLFFRCGMYLLLDYEGKDDSYILFQNLFIPYLAAAEVDRDALGVLCELLLMQLASLDDDFYDVALPRLIRDARLIGIDNARVGLLRELHRGLTARGYNLPITDVLVNEHD